jgi:hypothetical protein
MTGAANFRFDQTDHRYIDLDTGEDLPSITSMLMRVGLVDDTWMDEQGRARGTAVHELTKLYDLDALDVETCRSPFRPYLLAHVKAMSILRPTMLAVEEAMVHPVLRFGGRPDRIVTLNGRRGVWEIKSGTPERAHACQTALQAILAELKTGLPADAHARYACYLRPNGRFKVEEFTDRRDFDQAREVIQRCCNA